MTFPHTLWRAEAGLYSSCVLALHVARASGLVFRKDVILAYGRLGYLFFPLYVDRFLSLSAVAFSLRSERPPVDAIALALSGGIVESFIPFYLR